jgi:outer membrane murein-binding lipoprotein Lpp
MKTSNQHSAVSNQSKQFSVSSVFSVAILFVAIFLAGCNFNFQTVTPQSAQKLAADVNTLAVTLDKYQASVDQITTTLVAAGAIDPNAAAKLQATQTKIDAVQSQVQQTSQAVASQTLTDNDVTNWITIARAANAATIGFNPYAPVIEAGLTVAPLLIGLFGGIFGWLKKKDAAKKTAALTEVVKGGQWFKEKADANTVAAFRAAQDSAQSTDTKQLVGMIKATA